MKAISLLLPLVGATYVSAHGFLFTLGINGKTYTGNKPSGPTTDSVIRQVSTPEPNKGASNPALTCGPNAKIATQLAPANPGDKMTFDWRGEDLSAWPHDIGPMLTYMASCGSTTCDKFDASGAKWFKIDQQGKMPGDNSTWVQHQLRTGGVATATIPANLAPGSYLVRHEIIALHLATSMGGAEFYPACAQLTVGGNQNGAPAKSDLVSIPGAYSDNDPGIFDPTVFDPNAPYTFPGPPIASFINGAASPASPAQSGSRPASSNTAKASPVSPTGSAPAPSGTKLTSVSGQKCRLVKRSLDNDIDLFVVRPRHVSRIMRRIASSIY